MSADVAPCEAGPTSVQSAEGWCGGVSAATAGDDGCCTDSANEPSCTDGELKKNGSAVANEPSTSTDSRDAKSTSAEETDGEPTLALAGVIRASVIGDTPTASGAEKCCTKALATAPSEVAAVGGDEEEETEYFCGLGPWHPPWLQWMRDARVFTVLLCLFSTVEGALVSGLTAVVISTIERRYQLSSTATGALASMTDVAVLSSVIFISYIGGRGHKPRWLGVALIIEAVGAFVFSLPQFVFGRYEVGASGDLDMESCADGNDFSSDCASSNNAALAFFLIGNILIGVGAAPLFTIGTSYLDDIVHPKYVSIHLGAFYALAIIGPALGFGLGGLFLSVYVDPSVDTHLDPSDPGWVGAWWLCYIVCGILCLIIAVPFFFYPRVLPNNKEIRLLREQEMALKGRTVRRPEDRLSVVKNFPLEVKKIVTNQSWLFVTLGLSFASIAISGFASFGVKFTENQFGLTTSEASFITGLRTIPSAGLGVVTSGLLIYFFKIKGRKLPLMGLVTCSLLALTAFGLLLHCSTPDLAGVIVPYADGTVGQVDTSSFHPNCTSSCDCTSSVFEPVCGADNIVYFSPCQAGCPPNSNETGYEQCSCIADQLLSSTNSTPQSLTDLLLNNSTATEGLCGVDCSWQLPVYLLVTAGTLFLAFMLQVPNITITIRCVAEDQRTLALGLQSSIVRLIGFVPGPLLFGAVFDSACLFWQRDCGRRGNCWVYDNTALSTRIVVLGIGAIMFYIVFITLCWLVYPRDGLRDKNEGNSVNDKQVQTVSVETELRDMAGESGPDDSTVKL